MGSACSTYHGIMPMPAGGVPLAPLKCTFNGKQVPMRPEDAYGFPPWCMRDVIIDDKVKQLVGKSWKMILEGTAPPFKEAVTKDPAITPLVFFYNTFYETLFYLVPEARGLFRNGMLGQGRMLAHMINFAAKNITDPERMDETLKYLAVVHNQLGIKAPDYSTMCVCLLFALRKILGDEAFDQETKLAWVCVVSRMMQVMIPVVVAGEIHYDIGNLVKVHDYRNEAKKDTDLDDYSMRTVRFASVMMPAALSPRTGSLTSIFPAASPKNGKKAEDEATSS